MSNKLQWAAYDEPRRLLLSASCQRLIVRRTGLRTSGDRAFGVAALHLWNSLPADVATSQSLATFKERLKHFCSNSHTTDDHRLVTCLCSYLGLRQAKYCRIYLGLLTYLIAFIVS